MAPRLSTSQRYATGSGSASSASLGRAVATRRGPDAVAALVDCSSIKQLTSSIDAATVEAVTQRLDAEKSRQLGYWMVEAMNRMVDETSDLRREVGDLAKEVGEAKIKGPQKKPGVLI
jgi:hypothetical protein